MNVTPLVAGPAQAGSQPPVSKPGIGHPAGAGIAPPRAAVEESGFSALVALALGPVDGSAGAASSAAAGQASSHDGDQTEDASVDVDTGQSPLDAPVDAATLAMLIALAAPVPAPVQPIAQASAAGGAERGGVDLAVIDGASRPASMAAVPDVSARTVATPTGVAAGPAASFQDAPGAAGPGAAGPGAAVPAPDASADPSGAGQSAAGAEAAVAGPPRATAAASAGAGAPSTAPVPVPAPVAHVGPAMVASANAAPVDVAPADAALADPQARGGPRGAGRLSHQPLRQALRQALAAPAAASSSPSTEAASAPGTETQATGPAASPSIPAATAAVLTLLGGRGEAGHDSARPAGPRLDVLAAAPAAAGATAAAGASDGGTSETGERSFGSREAASASSSARAADLRFDVPSAAIGQGAPSAVAATEAIGAAAVASLSGLRIANDALTAIELPSAARFEQAMQSLDPDVRNLQAMVRTVRLFSSGTGVREARLTLDPEHLGPVALTVRVEQGSVSAHFRADTPAAHRWIETHQQELRNGLRDQGLEVSDVTVSTDPDGRSDRRQDAQPTRQTRARRGQPTDTRRFEVVV